MPPIELMLTIEPPPRLIISGTHSLVIRNVPVTRDGELAIPLFEIGLQQGPGLIVDIRRVVYEHVHTRPEFESPAH